MSEEQKEAKRRIRRSIEELKAHYQSTLRGIEENEKREVIRLLSGVSDDLQKATTYKAHEACKAEVTACLSQVKGALTKLGVK